MPPPPIPPISSTLPISPIPPPTEALPPEELPIIDELPIIKEEPITIKETPKISKAPLPSVEEFIAEAPELPKPPKSEPIPAPKIKKEIVSTKSTKTISFKKIILIIFFLLIIIAVGVFLYWQGKKSEPLPPPPSGNEVTIPAPLIPVDETKIIRIDINASFENLLRNEANTEQQTKTITRIVPMFSPNNEDKEVLAFNELIQKLGIAIYPYILPEFKTNYTLFLYGQDKGKIIGMVVEANNPNNVKEQAKYWEATMAEDLKNMFLFKKPGEPTTKSFKNNTYKSVLIRYINFPNPDLTIDYAIINNLFILSTSRESMYNIIDRLIP